MNTVGIWSIISEVSMDLRWEANACLLHSRVRWHAANDPASVAPYRCNNELQQENNESRYKHWGIYMTISEIPQFYMKLSGKTSCAHKWGQYTPALISTHLIQKYPIKISILQSCATQVGILQENIELSQKFFQKVPETPFSAKYLATRGLKMRLGTPKCIGVKKLTP